ncbi:hypothetical protein [Streptomyces sp. NPDC047014]|uniref:hypothetical protein n=1 Tax=Streptomyces sp. NPDC047014 TaxID=3155736 RepID=UPI00340E2BE5
MDTPDTAGAAATTDPTGPAHPTPHARVRRRIRTAGLFCAAAALAVGTSVPAAAQAAATVPMPAPRLVVVDCFQQPQTRPDEYILACGDGNNQLVDLDWKTWGPNTATATGTDLVNDCRPNCAAGRFRSYPVEVTLSKPQPWPDRANTHQFSQIRLLYTDTVPAPVARDVTYKLVY